jgi:hypothetical protein
MSPSTSPRHPLPDINDVAPLGQQDRACIEEVRDVLRRHDALQRFGLTLLHRHFELADDEVLVESVDVKKRIIYQLPWKISSVSSGVETAWRLDMLKELQHCETVCQVACDYDGVAYHVEEHERSSK